MIQRIPLKDCKLWWPAWQIGIPFESFGYGTKVAGHNYSFIINREMDSWLCPDGSLMPIASSRLFCKETELPFSSFSIIKNRVQVNKRVDDEAAYTVYFYLLEDLYMVGDTYRDDD